MNRPAIALAAVLFATGCPMAELPKLTKATRYDPGAETGRTPAEALPMDNVDARLTTLKDGTRAVAWSVCDDGGCEARVGLLAPGDDGAATVTWSQVLRGPDFAATGLRIDGIRQSDWDNDKEGEIIVAYTVLGNGKRESERVSVHDPTDLRLVTVLELVRRGPDARSCVLHLVDANGDKHRDLVIACKGEARPSVRTWRRSRDEWR